MKPKFKLFITDDNFRLIEKAGSVLSANGKRKEAKEIHQKASINGYDFYFVLKLLSEYLDVKGDVK
jgi:hypothetical protein